jgi:hypothetical protein
MGKMLPMNDALARQYGTRPRQHLADGGFAKLDDIEALAQNGVETFVPITYVVRDWKRVWRPGGGVGPILRFLRLVGRWGFTIRQSSAASNGRWPMVRWRRSTIGRGPAGRRRSRWRPKWEAFPEPHALVVVSFGQPEVRNTRATKVIDGAT